MRGTAKPVKRLAVTGPAAGRGRMQGAFPWPALMLLAGLLSLLGGCEALSLLGLFNTENPGPFSISPSAAVLQTGETITLRALGGFGEYTFDYPVPLQGIFEEASGLYTSPVAVAAEPLVESISVSDELGNQRTTTLTVYNTVAAPLAVSPASWTAVQDDVREFTISGGRFPYERSLDGATPVALPGSQATVDTAGLTLGAHRLEITDAMQTLVAAAITVIPAGELGIDPVSITVAPGATVVFTALNAVPPVSFSVDTGTGSFITPANVNPATYQAPGSGTTAEVIRLADATMRSVTATVYVVAAAPLAISPAYAEILVGETLELSARGGVPPYTFALTAGKGTVEQTGGDTALYTASATLPSRDQVCLTDSAGSVPVYAVVKVRK